MKKQDAVFVLDWDLASLQDDEYFAYLVEFPGWENILQFSFTKHYDLPDEIYFVGNLNKLRDLDFPYTNVRWPILSTRMVTILKQTGSFASREIPITMLDDTVSSSEHFSPTGEINAERSLKRFVAFQILDHLDAFDWKESEYEPSATSSTRVRRVERLCLKTPADGFPPIFRITAYPILVFVSAAARLALEGANIAGVSFIPLSENPY